MKTILIALLLSQATFAHTENEIKKHFTVVELTQAVSGLMGAVDGTPWCGLTETQAQELLLPLRPIYENALKTEQRRQTLKRWRTALRQCQDTCSCDLYSNLLINSKRLSKKESDLIANQLKSSTGRVTKECKTQRDRLCQSKLLQSLKKISDAEYNVNGVQDQTRK